MRISGFDKEKGQDEKGRYLGIELDGVYYVVNTEVVDQRDLLEFPRSLAGVMPVFRLISYDTARQSATVKRVTDNGLVRKVSLFVAQQRRDELAPDFGLLDRKHLYPE